MQRESIKELTSVRFIAALAVLLLHFSPWLELSGWVNSVAWQGRAGVSFFFILSGFILTVNYLDRFIQGVHRKALMDFSKARFARIYPMHAVALFFTAGIVLLSVWHATVAAEGEFPATKLAVTFAANLLLVHMLVPMDSFQQLWNAPAWSVGCEMFFYAAFPFLMAGIARRLKTRRAALMTVAGCILLSLLTFLGADLILKVAMPPGKAERLLDFLAYRNPLFRIWEFCAGCGIAVVFLQQRPAWLLLKRSRNVGIALSFVLMLMVVLAVVFHVPLAARLSWYVAYTPAFVLMILCLAAGPTWLSPLLCHPLLVLLGEASYALYLIHWPVKLVVGAICDGRPPMWMFGATVLGCVVASVICLKVIEQPARAWLRGNRKAGSNTRISVGGCSADT